METSIIKLVTTMYDFDEYSHAAGVMLQKSLFERIVSGSAEILKLCKELNHKYETDSEFSACVVKELQKHITERVQPSDETIQQNLLDTKIQVESALLTYWTNCIGSHQSNDIDLDKSMKLGFSLLCVLVIAELNNYSQILHLPLKGYSRLEQAFESVGHHLANEPNYSRYDLIEVTENRELVPRYPLIIDRQFKISVELRGISAGLYDQILFLKKEYSFRISFLPHHLNIFHRVEEITELRKAIEYGRVFDVSNLREKPIRTKLSNSDGDTFWVRVSSTELTFEEIPHNLQIYDDLYVTSLVHVQLCVRNDEPMISHIDHEYIFYTEDEFLCRQENPGVKGKGRKPIKTFKIDDAELPLLVDRILAPLIFLCMDNKKLVLEYFHKELD